MAVPGRRNGMVDDDDYEEDNALFEEDGVIEFDSDTPPHLRALATAAQLGDVNGLRTALGSTSSFTLAHCDSVYLLRLVLLLEFSVDHTGVFTILIRSK